MTWLIYGIIGFTILCGCLAIAIILFVDDEVDMESDWWRDQ